MNGIDIDNAFRNLIDKRELSKQIYLEKLFT